MFISYWFFYKNLVILDVDFSQSLSFCPCCLFYSLKKFYGAKNLHQTRCGSS